MGLDVFITTLYAVVESPAGTCRCAKSATDPRSAPTVPGKKKRKVRILNPPAGGATVTSLLNAERLVSRGRGYFDEAGNLVFNVAPSDLPDMAERACIRQAKVALPVPVSTRPGPEDQAAIDLWPVLPNYTEGRPLADYITTVIRSNRAGRP